MSALGHLQTNLLTIMATDGGQHWFVASDLVGAGMATTTKDAAHTLLALHARGLVEGRLVGNSASQRREWRIMPCALRLLERGPTRV